MEPTVGRPSDEWRAVCVYSPWPDDPECGAPAKRHVLVYSEAHGHEATLTSCTVHTPIACHAGRLIQHHAYDGVCGFPGTLWDKEANRCVLDDSAQEPAVVTSRLVTAE